jgi:glycosyltransferase involved in cell wall biosynthesis
MSTACHNDTPVPRGDGRPALPQAEPAPIPRMSTSQSRRPLRVAIACPGIGLVQRGFERFFHDLFGVMRSEFDVTLFKGGGAERENEKVLRFVHRNSRLVKLLPLHKLFHRTPLHSETLTFGLAMLPCLSSGAFDMVHTIDPPLTRLLFHLRNRLGLCFKLLYTEGCAMPPGDYPPADHIQQVAKATFDDALAFGYPTESMTLLPLGFHPERFDVGTDRAALRRAYGIDEDTFVMLSVAAINRAHKRTDHLIDEASRLDGNFLLWLDGSLDHGDPDLLGYARQRLGSRCRVTHVRSEQVGELYRLADVLVHTAYFEAFGLAVVEAAGSGTPVLTHNAPHFQWLIPNPECWFDTMQPGALAGRLRQLMSDRSRLEALRCAQTTRRRFAWDRLRPGYVELYRHVAQLPARQREALAETRRLRQERADARP